jgi:molybdopterin synthase catalytic subunit
VAIRVQHEDFSVDAEIRLLTGGDTEAGAVATFVGKVRATSEGRALSALSLEHYPGMTEVELRTFEADAVQRFSLSGCTIVHRVGRLLPGDNIVLVVTAAKHRESALSACAFLMDYLKTGAPFWKKQSFADGGEDEWVDARTSDDASRRRWATSP